jgi:hypothetical protein
LAVIDVITVSIALSRGDGDGTFQNCFGSSPVFNVIIFAPCPDAPTWHSAGTIKELNLPEECLIISPRIARNSTDSRTSSRPLAGRVRGAQSRARRIGTTLRSSMQLLYHFWRGCRRWRYECRARSDRFRVPHNTDFLTKTHRTQLAAQSGRDLGLSLNLRLDYPPRVFNLYSRFALDPNTTSWSC